MAFAHLPTDALCVVLQHVFRETGEAALPLSTFCERWTTLRLVCAHWKQVLEEHPPPLHLAVSTLPEAWLPWLLRLPVAGLLVEDGLDQRWSQPRGTGEEEEHLQHGGPPPGMPAPLSALQLVAGVEGAGGPQPFWSLAALTRLEALHLQAPVSSAEQPAVFDSEALQGLERLASLSLGSFADFRLEHLPAGLRRLRLRYDGQAHTLSVPHLPPHLSLERLRVEKPGALGACLDELWGQVAALELSCGELLLGVPVDDKQLIRTFERPYREGNFVPPHIWGDEEADDASKQAADMTANHLLACLPACPRLRALRLERGAAASAKFMPVAPAAVAPGAGRSALRWLWSVVRLQGLHHQFGLSGREMEARLEQLLLADSLHFKHSQGAAGPREPWTAIEVVAEAAPAGP